MIACSRSLFRTRFACSKRTSHFQQICFLHYRFFNVILYRSSLSNFSGPNEPILIPKIGCDVDLEVELCVVIGKDGKHIPKGNFSTRDKFGMYSECFIRQFQFR